MAISTPTAFKPFAPSKFGPGRPIIQGSSSGSVGELDLVDNQHFAYRYLTPMWVDTLFASDIEGASGVQPYVLGAATPVINGLWFRDTYKAPFTHWRIVVLYEETGGGTDGVIRFDLASDPYSGGTGTFVDLVASSGAGSSSSPAVATGVLSMGTRATDAVRMWVGNGSVAGVRVYQVSIWPEPPATILAGQNRAVAGHVFTPLDDVVLDADSGLAVAWRRYQSQNAEMLRATRAGGVLGWSENPQYRAGNEYHQTSSASYQMVIRLPFYAPPGFTRLRWGLFGMRAGSVGKVRLSTDYQDGPGGAPIEVDLNTGWTAPYTGNLHTYADAGAGDLVCREDAWNELRVSLRSDGAAIARLLSLSVWFEDI